MYESKAVFFSIRVAILYMNLFKYTVQVYNEQRKFTGDWSAHNTALALISTTLSLELSVNSK
jgi:hypothetical protein